MMKNKILDSLEKELTPKQWRINHGIEDGSEAYLPIYGTVRWEHGKLTHADPDLPDGYEAAIETDDEHHRAVRIYIGQVDRGIVIVCDISHDVLTGVSTCRWRNYYGASNYGNNVASGGRFIASYDNPNPKDGFETLEKALAARDDFLPFFCDMSERARLEAIRNTLLAAAKCHAAADNATVAGMHADGASCAEVSGCRGGLRSAIAANAAARAIEQLLKCAEQITKSDLERIERAISGI